MRWYVDFIISYFKMAWEKSLQNTVKKRSEVTSSNAEMTFLVLFYLIIQFGRNT